MYPLQENEVFAVLWLTRACQMCFGHYSVTRVQWASYGNWEKPMIHYFEMCAILTRQTEKTILDLFMKFRNILIHSFLVTCIFYYNYVCCTYIVKYEWCYRVCRWVHTIAGHCISIQHPVHSLSRHFLVILWWFLDVSFCLSVVELLFIVDISIIQCHTAVHPTGSNSLDQFKF